MCPADAITPNGVDCGIANYFDRQLAGAFGQGAKRYMQGPFRIAKPELGYQLPLTPAQFFRAGIQAPNGLQQALRQVVRSTLGAEADTFLQQLANRQMDDEHVALSRWFNELVYPLFAQACFADPMYGGNYEQSVLETARLSRPARDPSRATWSSTAASRIPAPATRSRSLTSL